MRVQIHIDNAFELEGMKALVVNEWHMRTLPSRKIDVKDAKWISDLLRHGLLKESAGKCKNGKTTKGNLTDVHGRSAKYHISQN